MASVWQRIVRKQARCYYCKEPIVKNTIMVIVQHFNHTTRHTTTNRFHPQCWIEQGEVALRMKKNEIVETRGRKSLPLNKEAKEERCRLLKRHATVNYRINQEMEEHGEGLRIDRLISFGEQINQLKEEIALVGGVPPSWER